MSMSRLLPYTFLTTVIPIRHRPMRWITPLRYKNVSLIRHPAPSSSAFPLLRIATVKAWYFPLLFIQSPKFNNYYIRRYSQKCWPVRFTYNAPSLITVSKFNQSWQLHLKKPWPLFSSNLVNCHCIQVILNIACPLINILWFTVGPNKLTCKNN